MHYKFIIFILLATIYPCHSSTIELITFNKTTLDSGQKKRVLKGKTFAHSIANKFDGGKQQNFNFKIAALHPKSCNVALRKLSRYETFKNYIAFVTNSHYDELTQMVYFRLESSLLPFNMVLRFKLERIKKPGVYQFSFGYGFLKGLKGEIHVSEKDKRCFFYTKAKWTGPYTKIPSLLLEFFTEALSKIVVDKLFLISRV